MKFIKNTKIRKISGELFWLFFGQILTVIASLVLLRLVTGYVDPEKFGILGLGLTVCVLIDHLIMGGLSNGISRFYSVALEKRCIRDYLLSSMHLLAIASLLILLIGFLIIVLVQYIGYKNFFLNIVFIFIVLSVFNGFNSAFTSIQNAARQRKVVAFHNVLNSCLKIPFVMIFVFFFGGSVFAIALGYVFSVITTLVSQTYFIMKLLPPQKESNLELVDWKMNILSFSMPFSKWGIFTWLQQSSDRWSLQAFGSTENVGFYSALYQISLTPISMMSNMLISFISPILYHRAGDAKDDQRTSLVHSDAIKITSILVVTTFFVFFISLFTHQYIFNLLVSKEYTYISYLMPWCILAGGILAAAQFLSVRFMIELNTHSLVTVKISTSILGALMNVFAVLLYGINGLVISQVTFSLIYFSWIVGIAWRK